MPTENQKTFTHHSYVTLFNTLPNDHPKRQIKSLYKSFKSITAKWLTTHSVVKTSHNKISENQGQDITIDRLVICLQNKKPSYTLIE